VRLPTALVGVLNVLLMFVLARRLFKRDDLVLAVAALLALTLVHFIHSRLALSIICPLPFILAWLISLSRYDEHGRPRDLVMAVACLGLGVYSYLACVVMMPLYLGFIGVLSYRRPAMRGAGWAAAALVVVLIPLLLWQIVHPDRYTILIHDYRLSGAPGQGLL
jgi:4-amino-4-deoxy-L-arabinose transferase-like glycosyltransferase